MSLYDRIATAALLSGAYDDGLTTRYEVAVGASPNHIQYTGGLGRSGVRFETGSAGLTKKVMSVWIRFRTYGSPTGNITINIRKASDDTVAATIGTFPINSNQFPPSGGESELVLRNRFGNTYQMVANDIVSIEYPSNATDGFEITTNSSASDPSGYTSRTHSGTWGSALSDPFAVIIKTD